MSTSVRIIPPVPVMERGVPSNSFSCVDGTLIFGSGATVSVFPADGNPGVVNHHGTKVTAAAISPNGLWVATGDSKGMVCKTFPRFFSTFVQVKLWSSRGDRLQKYEFRPIASGIRGICWSPDNRKIAVVGGESGRGGEGICISYDTGSAAGQAFSGHSKPITCVAFRPVPPFRIITGSEDMSVVFHEGPPFKFMKSCQSAHSNFVNAVAFSPDGSRAFSCGSDGIVAVFTGDTGDLLTVLDPKLNCSIWGIAPGSRGEIFAACADKKIRAISGETCAVMSELTVGDEARDTPLGITSDVKKSTVHVVSLDGSIREYGIGENSELILKSTIHGSSGPISSIIPGKECILVGSASGSVWSLAKPLLTAGITPIHSKKPIKGTAGLLLDVVEILGISATSNELVNLKTGDLKKHPLPDIATRLIRSKPLGFALGDKSTKINRLHQPWKTFELNGTPGETIGAFAVSDDGEVMVVAPQKDRSGITQENREIIINMKTHIKTEITHSDIVNLAVSPDGSAIAIASGGQEIHVYKRDGPSSSANYVLIPETAKVWTYHKGRITCMHWVDSNTLVTGGLDKTIYVWDTTRAINGPVTSLRDQHKEGVSALYASRDSGTLTIVSGGHEGSVRINQIQ